MEESNENQIVSSQNLRNDQILVEHVNLNSGLKNAPLLLQNLGQLFTFAKSDFSIQAENQAFEF